MNPLTPQTSWQLAWELWLEGTNRISLSRLLQPEFVKLYAAATSNEPPLPYVFSDARASTRSTRRGYHRNINHILDVTSQLRNASPDPGFLRTFIDIVHFVRFVETPRIDGDFATDDDFGFPGALQTVVKIIEGNYPDITTDQYRLVVSHATERILQAHADAKVIAHDIVAAYDDITADAVGETRVQDLSKEKRSSILKQETDAWTEKLSVETPRALWAFAEEQGFLVPSLQHTEREMLLEAAKNARAYLETFTQNTMDPMRENADTFDAFCALLNRAFPTQSDRVLVERVCHDTRNELSWWVVQHHDRIPLSDMPPAPWTAFLTHILHQSAAAATYQPGQDGWIRSSAARVLAEQLFARSGSYGLFTKERGVDQLHILAIDARFHLALQAIQETMDIHDIPRHRLTMETSPGRLSATGLQKWVKRNQKHTVFLKFRSALLATYKANNLFSEDDLLSNVYPEIVEEEEEEEVEEVEEEEEEEEEEEKVEEVEKVEEEGQETPRQQMTEEEERVEERGGDQGTVASSDVSSTELLSEAKKHTELLITNIEETKAWKYIPLDRIGNLDNLLTEARNLIKDLDQPSAKVETVYKTNLNLWERFEKEKTTVEFFGNTQRMYNGAVDLKNFVERESGKRKKYDDVVKKFSDILNLDKDSVTKTHYDNRDKALQALHRQQTRFLNRYGDATTLTQFLFYETTKYAPIMLLDQRSVQPIFIDHMNNLHDFVAQGTIPFRDDPYSERTLETANTVQNQRSSATEYLKTYESRSKWDTLRKFRHIKPEWLNKGERLEFNRLREKKYATEDEPEEQEQTNRDIVEFWNDLGTKVQEFAEESSTTFVAKELREEIYNTLHRIPESHQSNYVWKTLNQHMEELRATTSLNTNELLKVKNNVDNLHIQHEQLQAMEEWLEEAKDVVESSQEFDSSHQNALQKHINKIDAHIDTLRENKLENLEQVQAELIDAQSLLQFVKQEMQTDAYSEISEFMENDLSPEEIQGASDIIFTMSLTDISSFYQNSFSFTSNSQLFLTTQTDDERDAVDTWREDISRDTNGDISIPKVTRAADLDPHYFDVLPNQMSAQIDTSTIYDNVLPMRQEWVKKTNESLSIVEQVKQNIQDHQRIVEITGWKNNIRKPRLELFKQTWGLTTSVFSSGTPINITLSTDSVIDLKELSQVSLKVWKHWHKSIESINNNIQQTIDSLQDGTPKTMYADFHETRKKIVEQYVLESAWLSTNIIILSFLFANHLRHGLDRQDPLPLRTQDAFYDTKNNNSLHYKKQQEDPELSNNLKSTLTNISRFRRNMKQYLVQTWANLCYLFRSYPQAQRDEIQAILYPNDFSVDMEKQTTRKWGDTFAVEKDWKSIYGLRASTWDPDLTNFDDVAVFLNYTPPEIRKIKEDSAVEKILEINQELTNERVEDQGDMLFEHSQESGVWLGESLGEGSELLPEDAGGPSSGAPATIPLHPIDPDRAQDTWKTHLSEVLDAAEEAQHVPVGVVREHNTGEWIVRWILRTNDATLAWLNLDRHFRNDVFVHAEVADPELVHVYISSATTRTQAKLQSRVRALDRALREYYFYVPDAVSVHIDMRDNVLTNRLLPKTEHYWTRVMRAVDDLSAYIE